MIEIIKIGDIVLDNPLFYKESVEFKYVTGSAYDTLGGTKIVYQKINRNSALNITLISEDWRWLSEITINKILALGDELNVTTTLTTKEGDTINARFRIEDAPVLQATPIFENSNWYKVTIKMARFN